MGPREYFPETQPLLFYTLFFERDCITHTGNISVDLGPTKARDRFPRCVFGSKSTSRMVVGALNRAVEVTEWRMGSRGLRWAWLYHLPIISGWIVGGSVQRVKRRLCLAVKQTTRWDTSPRWSLSLSCRSTRGILEIMDKSREMGNDGKPRCLVLSLLLQICHRRKYAYLTWLQPQFPFQPVMRDEKENLVTSGLFS